MSSIADVLEADRNAKNAKKTEPLLGEAGNERRRITLERVGSELAKSNNRDHGEVLSLLRSMRPNSIADAWDTLYFELARINEEGLAETVANECQHMRVEAWMAMRTDEDVISQIGPFGAQFFAAYASAINSFRKKLETMLNYAGGSFRPGAGMEDYVVNMARFGSGADDWMTKVVIEEMYLKRGMFEQAFRICERMIRFKGHDRRRMMASTLIEDVLNMVLGSLHECEEPGHVDYMVSRGLPISPKCKEKEHLEGLKKRCLRLLVRRARSLGLKIRPDPKENNLLREGSAFAQKIGARRRIRGAGEIGAHSKEGHPRSWEFLGLDARALERMVGGKAPLVQNITVQMECQEIAAARNAECPVKSALDILEPMLEFVRRENVQIKPGTAKKWRKGICGDQMLESLLEMDIYLRLVREGASVEHDVKVKKLPECEEGKRKAGDGGAGGGKGGTVEIDLEVDGCLAEVYSAAEGEVLVGRHATRVDRPGEFLMSDALRKRQLCHAGDRSMVLIVECAGGEFFNIEVIRGRMEAQLGEKRQPGAIFFILQDGDGYRVEPMVNPNPAAPKVPEAAMRAIQGALGLEAPW